MRIEKRHISFLIASVLCLPLLVFGVLLLIGVLLDLVFGDCTDAIAIPVLYGVWWVSEYPIRVSLALGAASLVVLAAWLESKKTRAVVTLLSLYSAAIVLCVGYLIWWHASGSVFDL